MVFSGSILRWAVNGILRECWVLRNPDAFGTVGIRKKLYVHVHDSWKENERNGRLDAGKESESKWDLAQKMKSNNVMWAVQLVFE